MESFIQELQKINWIELGGQQVLIELLESTPPGQLRLNIVDVSAPCVFARRAEIPALSTGRIARLRMRGSVCLFRLACRLQPRRKAHYISEHPIFSNQCKFSELSGSNHPTNGTIEHNHPNRNSYKDIQGVYRDY